MLTSLSFILIFTLVKKSEFQKIQKLIKTALKEDIGRRDITSNLVIPKQRTGKGIIFAREKGIVAGLEVVESVFKQIDPSLTFKASVKDGAELNPGQKVASVKGRVRSILTAERTALNFLQRLSGIATLTQEFVKKTKGTKVKILDTRKTTPGLRLLEKYAVKTGGGENHRMGLYDMILIKDNHIQSIGTLSSALKKALSGKSGFRIEVETKNLEQVKEALNFRVDRIMLDNFSIKDLKKGVELIRSKDNKVEIEASGRVKLKNVREIALSGIDYISIGELTHSPKAIDFSLDLIVSKR